MRSVRRRWTTACEGLRESPRGCGPGGVLRLSVRLRGGSGFPLFPPVRLSRHGAGLLSSTIRSERPKRFRDMTTRMGWFGRVWSVRRVCIRYYRKGVALLLCFGGMEMKYYRQTTTWFMRFNSFSCRCQSSQSVRPSAFSAARAQGARYRRRR